MYPLWEQVLGYYYEDFMPKIFIDWAYHGFTEPHLLWSHIQLKIAFQQDSYQFTLNW